MEHAAMVFRAPNSSFLFGRKVGIEEAGRLLHQNVTLQSIILTACQIGDEEAAALANALQTDKTLTALFLNDNEIGVAGAVALARALCRNNTLATLSLEKNRIGDAGAAALARALRNNNALTTLYLTCNQIGDAGALVLLQSLRKNYRLTGLQLWHNPIGNRMLEQTMAIHLNRNADLNANRASFQQQATRAYRVTVLLLRTSATTIPSTVRRDVHKCLRRIAADATIND